MRIATVRFTTAVLSVALALPFALTACSSDDADAEPFDTLAACFDEHHNEEKLETAKAIVVCCLDHPIGASAEHPSCKATQADCVSHVTTELSGQSVMASEVQAACTDYISQK